MQLKAITLHEPWGTFIVNHKKKIETRSWHTNYRGRIYIHTAQVLPAYAKDEIRTNSLFQAILILNGFDIAKGFDFNEDVFKTFKLGYIIGAATIADCLPSEKIRKTLANIRVNNPIDDAPESLKTISLKADEIRLGNYASNRFGFVFKDVVKFDNPVKCKGFQRIWNINNQDVIRQVKEQDYAEYGVL